MTNRPAEEVEKQFQTAYVGLTGFHHWNTLIARTGAVLHLAHLPVHRWQQQLVSLLRRGRGVNKEKGEQAGIHC